MRSLLNYCFDLPFQRPRVEQIKGAMMSVAFKEGVRIAPPALQEIIVGANQDVRQILHNLSMWTVKEKIISYEQAKDGAHKAQKYIHMVHHLYFVQKLVYSTLLTSALLSEPV